MALTSVGEAARRIEVTPRQQGGAELRGLLQADVQRWKAAIQATGIQLET